MKRMIFAVLLSMPLALWGQQTRTLFLKWSQDDFSVCHGADGNPIVCARTAPSSYGSDMGELGLPYVPVYCLVGPEESYDGVSMDNKEMLFKDNITIGFAPQATSTRDTELPPIREIRYVEDSYPYKPVLYTGTHTMGGYKMLSFLVCPFRYDARASILYFKEDISLSVRTIPLKSKSRTVINSDKAGFVMSMAVNGDELPTLYSRIVDAQKRSSGFNNGYEYLIVTADSLRPAFQPLADWKSQKGCHAKILTTEEIDSIYTGASRQLRIKKALKDYYDGSSSGLKYVLLGGDVDIVPARMCLLRREIYYQGDLFSSEEDMTPADQYYACFDNNFEWDANGNGIYAELGDSVDLLPDIAVTRIPIKDFSEATSFVYRILEYECSHKPSAMDNKMLMCGSQLNYFTDDSGQKGDTLYARYIQPYWSGQRVRLYSSTSDFPGNSLYDFTREHLQQELSKGYPFVDILAHGEPTRMKMEVPNSPYDTTFAKTLFNPGKSLVVANSCLTNAFDVDPLCLGEAFMRNPNSGVIGYIGSSRETWFSKLEQELGDGLELSGEFYKALFNDSEKNFGSLVNHAKCSRAALCGTYNTSRWSMLVLNPLGDPEMPVFTDVPKTFDNISAELGNSFISMTTGVDSCKVCMMSRYGSGGTLYFVEDNTDHFNKGFLSAEHCITVTKQGYVPYTLFFDNNLRLQDRQLSRPQTINVLADNIQIGNHVNVLEAVGSVEILGGRAVVKCPGVIEVNDDFVIGPDATVEITNN